MNTEYSDVTHPRFVLLWAVVCDKWDPENRSWSTNIHPLRLVSFRESHCWQLWVINHWWVILSFAWNPLIPLLVIRCYNMLSCHHDSYILVGGLFFFFMFPYIRNNHPDWRTHIFQRGRSTTNQSWYHLPAFEGWQNHQYLVMGL